MVRKVVGDIEANGLLHQVTKTWCIYVIDVLTEEGHLFHDYPEYDNAEVYDKEDDKTYIIPKRKGSFIEGVKFLNEMDQFICHNSLGYDWFLLKKFHGKDYTQKPSQMCDTLIRSKMYRYDRMPVKGAKGLHGLDPWGIRVGVKKPPITDWSYIDAYKLHRCIEDVKINLEVHKRLELERKELLDLGFMIDDAEFIEKQYVYWTTRQEARGALIDVEAGNKLADKLIVDIKALADKIEPRLPPRPLNKGEMGDWTPPKIQIKTEEIYFPKAITKKNGELTANFLKWETNNPNFDYDFMGTLVLDDGTHLRLTEDHYNGTKPVKIKSEPSHWMSNWLDKIEAKRSKKDPLRFKFQDEVYTLSIEDKPIIDTLPMKLKDRAHLKNWLESEMGWEPDEWNHQKKDGKFVKDEGGQLIQTSPKLTESSLHTIKDDTGLGQDIIYYESYNHRLRFLRNEDDDQKGILNNLTEDNRLRCGISAFGTATGRSAQYGWVNAPGEGSILGEEIRSLIIAPKGKKLVGCDMKSAQLAIAGYYANNYEYLKACETGQEFDQSGEYIGQSAHCLNVRAFGMVTEDQYQKALDTQDKELIHDIGLLRKKSKGGSFSCLFGASGKKVGKTIGVKESEGQMYKDNFLQGLGLDEVMKILKRMKRDNTYKSGFYIELPMGYVAWCKSDHKAFNYLDQGTEAVAQKLAVIHFEKELIKRKWSGKVMKILDVHDEYLVECDEDLAEEVGKLMCESYKVASDQIFEWHKNHSRYFKHLLTPFNLDGGYAVGDNYLQCH